jgi:uncharacterized protein (DUF885 family)
MKLRLVLAASSALLLVAAPAFAETAAAPTAATATAAQTEHDKLFALFEDADARELALNPLGRLFRGDDSNADTLGDSLTDTAFIAARTDTQLNLALLAQIDRAKLSPTDSLAYDVFKYTEERALAGASDRIRELTEVRPLNHFFGIHTFYPNFASGKGVAPFKTLANYEDNLKRHNDYVTFVDRAIAKFREGMASGVVETRLTVEIMVTQLDTQINTPLVDSMFMGPVKSFPEGISEADKTRLTAAYEAKTREIYAANTRLRDFLRDEYLPVSRTSIGLSQMKGGAELYALLVEDSTTLPLKPEEIHQLGLSEVTRIKTELEALKADVGC